MPIMQFHFLAGAHVPPQPLNAPGTLDARQCQYHSRKPSACMCICNDMSVYVYVHSAMHAQCACARKCWLMLLPQESKRDVGEPSTQGATKHCIIISYVHDTKILLVEN